MTKKINTQIVRDIIKDMYKSEYTLLNEYENNKTKLKLKHECGYIYEIGYKTFINEKKGICPKCNTVDSHSTKRKTEEEIKELVAAEIGYTYISGFKNTHSKILVKHESCCNIFETSAHMFLGSKKRRCPVCSNLNRGKYAIKKDYLSEVLGNETAYTWMEEYKNNNKIKHLIKHSCGHEYLVRPNDFQQGYRCPACSFKNGESKSEKELLSEIAKLYQGTIIPNYRDGLEIDIFFPNEKIGIEFNGLYWHSELFKDDNYHINKTKHFYERGIRIIHIFEDEFLKKKDIVLNKILNILNLKKEKIYARNTILKEITFKEASTFLEKTHIQGKGQPTTYNFGLEYNNELVAVMTLNKANRKSLNQQNNENEYELVRFSSNINVVGGFSKLLKYSILKIKDMQKIISFADMRFTSGNSNVYLRNGFMLENIAKPSYYYTNGKARFNRFNYAKFKLKDLENYSEEKSESEILKENNLYKIYNCGNYKYYMQITR